MVIIFSTSQQMMIDILLLSSLVFIGLSYLRRRKLPLLKYRHYRPELFKRKEDPPNPVEIPITINNTGIIAIVVGAILMGGGFYLSSSIEIEQEMPASYDYSNHYYYNSFDGYANNSTSVEFHGKIDAITDVTDERSIIYNLNSTNNTNFIDVVLTEIDLNGTVFRVCTFTNVVFNGCTLDNVTFEDCKLSIVAFENCTGEPAFRGTTQVRFVSYSRTSLPTRILWFNDMPVAEYDGIDQTAAYDPGDSVIIEAQVQNGSAKVSSGDGRYQVLRMIDIKSYTKEYFNTHIALEALGLAVAGIVVAAFGLLSFEKNGLLIGMVGWIIYGLFWFSYIPYFSEIGDTFNVYALAAVGIVFLYLSTREYLNMKNGLDHHTMRWAAGAVFIGSAMYFAIDKIPILSAWLIQMTASNTAYVGNLVGYPMSTGKIDLMGNPWYYRINPESIRIPMYAKGENRVSIILACTGIQSMIMYFAAMVALDTKGWKKYFWAVWTVVLIYTANLFRNAGIVIAVTEEIWGPNTFELAHNEITKVLSVILLIIITLIIFNDMPEFYDNLMGAFDLPNVWKRLDKVRKNSNESE